jgi:type 1 glutamine amidotransferase
MDPIKTLLFAGGQIHDFKGCGNEIERILRADPAFDVTKVEEDLSVFEGLDGYDLVVFYYTVGEITDEQRNGLTNFVKSGKGFVGVHSAADSFREDPAFRYFIGGFFVTHPHFRSYQVSVVDPENPITRDLDEFMVEDEQYITDYDPRVDVLATALYKGKAWPVAWTKSWGDGRIFYLALGHNPEACRHDMFELLLGRGGKWAAGRETE